jgi:hypothetical protein
MNALNDLFDPCNLCPICSCLITMCIISIVMTFMSPSYSATDYVKFVFFSILIYYYYETVIKGKKPLCGINGCFMWSSILLIMIFYTSFFLTLTIMYHFPADIACYFSLIFFAVPCTLCCVSRLWFSGGPFTASFFNPTTITKLYI